MEPLVKVTLTLYVPVEVFLPTATVKDAVALPPEDNVRLLELRLAVGLCRAVGVIEADMLIGPVNPFRLVRVRVETEMEEFV
jgi:hypothetical protein